MCLIWLLILYLSDMWLGVIVVASRQIP
jgi:hypothetical protein